MASPARRGRVFTLTLDFDAATLLPILAPNSKAYGQFLSELIRTEQVRRETRRETQEELARAQLEDEGLVLVEP